MRLLLLPLACLVGCGEPVVTGYEAVIVTIAGAPFGLSGESDRLKTITGSFSWHTANLDADASDDVGRYQHPGDGDFSATLPNGVEVTNSGFSEVVVQGTTALRISDTGQQGGAGSELLVDGEPDSNVTVSIYMENVVPVFTDDQLPTVFPDLNAANWSTELTGAEGAVIVPGNGGVTTFSISDFNGSLLMGFTSLSDQTPQ